MKGGTGYMATYAMGVLPLREGLTGRAGSRRTRAHVPADQAEWCAELEFGQHMARKGGAA